MEKRIKKRAIGGSPAGTEGLYLPKHSWVSDAFSWSKHRERDYLVSVGGLVILREVFLLDETSLL